MGQALTTSSRITEQQVDDEDISNIGSTSPGPQTTGSGRTTVVRAAFTRPISDLRVPKDVDRNEYAGTPFVGVERYTHMAWQFINRFRHRIPIETTDDDLLQECYIAIMKAMKDFEARRGLCMFTLIYSYTRQRVLNLIKYGRFKKNQMVRNAGRDLSCIIALDPLDRSKCIDLIYDIQTKLDVFDREVFNCMVQGFNIDDIASRMRTSKKMIGLSMRRVRFRVCVVLQYEDPDEDDEVYDG